VRLGSTCGSEWALYARETGRGAKQTLPFTFLSWKQNIAVLAGSFWTQRTRLHEVVLSGFWTFRLWRNGREVTMVRAGARLFSRRKGHHRTK
jgi:hypothetical protein